MTVRELADATELTKQLTKFTYFQDLMDSIRGGKIPLLPCSARGFELAKVIKRCGGVSFFTI